MPKESVLSVADKEAIVIEKLIVHIILKDDVQPFWMNWKLRKSKLSSLKTD